MAQQQPYEWTLSEIFQVEGRNTDHSNVSNTLIILNRPLDIKNELFLEIWRKSSLRICADGGANSLFYAHDETTRSQFLPHAIVGDMDSIRKEVRTFYEDCNVNVVEMPSQYATDFGKALQYHFEHAPSHAPVIVWGDLGGRVDQSFSLFNYLYHYKDAPLYLAFDNNIAFLLKQGPNLLHLNRDVFDKHCGIIPLLGPTNITTKGLEWDLDNHECLFGGMVSTSNHIVHSPVYISTGKPSVFTAVIRK